MMCDRWMRTNTAGSSCSSRDRKSTRLNSSHANISYAVFCLKKKTVLRVVLSVAALIDQKYLLQVIMLDIALGPECLLLHQSHPYHLIYHIYAVCPDAPHASA